MRLPRNQEPGGTIQAQKPWVVSLGSKTKKYYEN